MRQPATIAWQLGFPVVMVLIFVYVFGSAMDIPARAPIKGYLDYAMPGLFAMTMAFGFMNTAFAVAIEQGEGGHRPVPLHADGLLGRGHRRGVSDIIQAAVDLLILAAIALALGWRSGSSLAATWTPLSCCCCFGLR